MKYLITITGVAFLFNCVFVVTTWPLGNGPSLGSHELARWIFNLRTPLNILFGLGFIGLLILNYRKTRRLRPITNGALILAMSVSIAIAWYLDANRIFRTLQAPTMVVAEGVKLPADLRLVSVTLEGESHAYPLQYLAYHHLITDEVGGSPLDITYCVLADSVSAFDHDPDTSLELIAARDGNSVYRDRETGSWWQQETGKSIAGNRAGASLRMTNTERFTFSQWRRKYPSGKIMLPEPEYQGLYTQFFPLLWPQE